MQLPTWRMHSIWLLRMRFNARKIITGHPQMARAPFATQEHNYHPPASPGSDQVVVQTTNHSTIGMGCDQTMPKPCLTLNLLVEHVDIMYKRPPAPNPWVNLGMHGELTCQWKMYLYNPVKTFVGALPNKKKILIDPVRIVHCHMWPFSLGIQRLTSLMPPCSHP